MFSESFGATVDNQKTVTEYDSTVGPMALTSHFSGDLQDLDNITNSMIAKTSNKSVRGNILYKCTLCGKEAEPTNLKNHIEANHLEGTSVPCNLCEKIFRTRSAWRSHNIRNHQ